MPSTSVVIGLDAGASKTLLLAERPARNERIERRGPDANPNRIGRTEAAEVLIQFVKDTVQDLSAVSHLSLCAGVAGAGRPHEQRTLAEALRADLEGPGRTVDVEVVSDAQIALDAAYDTGSGVVVIAGTGSMGMARATTGDLVRAGGWGHVLGDAGSGHALGRAGLRAVAEAFDGGDETVLQTRVCERFGIETRDDLLRTVYRDDFDVAAVAPLVAKVAEEDAVAAKILDAQMSKLTDQVEWLLARTEAIAPHITLLGGLLQNEYYEQCLRRHLRDRFPDWTVEVLQGEPVVGALRRARRLRSKQQE